MGDWEAGAVLSHPPQAIHTSSSTRGYEIVEGSVGGMTGRCTSSLRNTFALPYSYTASRCSVQYLAQRSRPCTPEHVLWNWVRIEMVQNDGIVGAVVIRAGLVRVHMGQ